MNVERTNNDENRETGKQKNRNEKTRYRQGRYNILGLCEIRCPDNGDFWSDNIRVIHTNSTKRYQAGVRMALNKKWGTYFVCELQMSNVVTYSSRLCLAKMESTSSNLRIIGTYKLICYRQIQT